MKKKNISAALITQVNYKSQEKMRLNKIGSATYQIPIYMHGARQPVQGTPLGSTNKKGMKCYNRHTVCTHTTHLTFFVLQVIACILFHPLVVFLS